MLTPEQFGILERLYSCSNHTHIRTPFLDQLAPDDRLRVLHLVSIGMIRDSYRDFSLTAKGLAAMDEYRSALENARQQCAKEKAEKKENREYQAKQDRKSRRHDYLVTGIEILLGYIVGVAQQAKLDVVGFVADIFERIASLFH